MGCDRWVVKKTAGPLGAWVSGCDLATSFNELQKEEFRSLLWSHRLLIFRDQTLKPKDHARLAAYFGELRIPETHQQVAQTEGLQRVIKEKDHEFNFGGAWHSDGSFMERPPAATLLHAQELPPSGGDTLFANCVLAYEELSTDMKSRLSKLSAIHQAHGVTEPGSYNPDEENEIPVHGNAATHPVVGVHPHTTQKHLYVNQTFTRRFVGMTQEESDDLLAVLARHIVKDEMIYRHQWQMGDLLIWDNYCTQHYALNDYAGHRRVMHRAVAFGAH